MHSLHKNFHLANPVIFYPTTLATYFPAIVNPVTTLTFNRKAQTCRSKSSFGLFTSLIPEYTQNPLSFPPKQRMLSANSATIRSRRSKIISSDKGSMPPATPMASHDNFQEYSTAPALTPSWAKSRRFKFCPECGQATVRLTPPGDERERDVCPEPSCAVVHYMNPKVVVGAICLWDNKVLLCRRAIEPCRGKWGFPQGFMELGESCREGALREVQEEAEAEAELGPLLALYTMPGQVQLLYLGQLKSPHFSPGVESLEVGLFSWNEIESMELAFPTVGWALEYAKKVHNMHSFPPQQRTKVFGYGEPSKGSFIEEGLQLEFNSQSKL